MKLRTRFLFRMMLLFTKNKLQLTLIDLVRSVPYTDWTERENGFALLGFFIGINVRELDQKRNHPLIASYYKEQIFKPNSMRVGLLYAYLVHKKLMFIKNKKEERVSKLATRAGRDIIKKYQYGRANGESRPLDF